MKKILFTILISLIIVLPISTDGGLSPPDLTAENATLNEPNPGALDIANMNIDLIAVLVIATEGPPNRGSPTTIIAGATLTFDKNYSNVFTLYTYGEAGTRVWENRQRAEVLKLPIEALARNRFIPTVDNTYNYAVRV